MPTNDERREVAARLRKKYGERQGTFEPQSISIQAMNRLDDLLDCLPKRRDMFLDLADLIEPEERTCEMYRDEDGVWHCKSCEDGADKITGSDGTLDNWCDSWHPNYCPNCGCRVKED